MSAQKVGTGRLNAFLFTVLLLLIPLSLYYFVYIPKQRDYFTSRGFRLLGDMSQQAKSQVENYDTILRNAAAITALELEDSFRKDEESFRRAGSYQEFLEKLTEQTIRQKLQDAFTLVRGLQLRYLKIRVGEDKDLGESYYHAVFDSSSTGGFYAQSAGARFQNTRVRVEMEGDAFWVNFFSQFYFRDASRFKEVEAYTVYLHTRIKLRDIVGTIFNRPEFEHILLMDRHGRVVLQHNREALLATQLDSLLMPPEVRKNFQSLLRYSQLLDVNIAGTNFKMFTQPVSLSLSEAPGPEEKAVGVEDGQAGKNIEWAVCGLIESSTFNSQVRAISYTYVLGFIFLFLLGVLSLPLVRLWHMGPTEKLRRKGVLALVIAGVLFTAIVTFLLIDSVEYNHATGVVDHQLEEFCREIETRFRRELVAAHKQLVVASREMLAELNSGGSKQVTNILSSRQTSLQTYPYFDMIALVDSSGKQRVKWSVKKVGTPLINVSTRPYFRDAKAGRLNALDHSTRFALQPIFSRNTGENLTAMAIPVDTTGYVAVMTTRFLSLNSPVVPRGFGFAVINRDGDVLFHSDEQKNLRENFIEECDRNSKLRSAVFARVGKMHNADYQGRGHKLYVHPLQDFPWLIVGFRDKLILRTTNLELMSESVLLFVLYVSIFLVLLSGFYMLRPHYWAEWLFPVKEKSLSYLHLALVYILQCIVFFMWIFVYDAYQIVHTVFFLPLLAMLLAYLELKHAERQRRKLIGVILILTVGVMLGGTIFLSKADLFRSVLKCLLLIIALTAIFATLFAVRTRKLLEGIQLFIGYRQAYVVMIVSLLVMISIVPAVVFHKFAFDEEVQLATKHRQLKLYRALQERSRRVVTGYSDVALRDRAEFLARRLAVQSERGYADIYAYAQTDTIFFEKSTAHACGDVDESGRYLFDLLLMGLRPLRNDIAVETRELTQIGAADSTWCWTNTGVSIIFHTEETSQAGGQHTASHGQGHHRGEELHIKSLLIDFRPHRSGVWWLSISFVIAALFPLVRFVARRVLLLELEEPTDLYHDEIFSRKITKNLLVLGPPASGKSKILKTAKGQLKSMYQMYDLALYASPESLPDENEIKKIPGDKIVAIDHFGHRIDDKDWNYAKFQFLRTLLYSYKRTVVVISTLDPLFHFEKNASTSGSVDADKTVTLDDWAMVFSAFLKVYYEDEGDSIAFSKKLRAKRRAVAGNREKVNKLYDILEAECRHSSHLKSVALAISELGSFPQMSQEELLAQFHEWVAGYYRAIWGTCSSEEKLVISHLARYGFLNAQNPELVRRLLRRRLIQRQGVFKLMNETFKRFVLTPQIKNEVDSLEEGLGASSWGRLKVPIFTILVGAGLFVLITQQEAFNATLAVLSALAASVPALVRLVGLFRGRQAEA